MGFVTNHATGLLLIANIFIGGLGLVILAFGGFVLNTMKTHPYGTAPFPNGLAITLMSIGGVVAIMAMIGAIRGFSNPTIQLTKLYYFLMISLVVAQIVLVSANYKWKYGRKDPDPWKGAKCDIKYAMKDYLNKYKKGNKEATIWDTFQETHKCCGVKGKTELPKELKDRIEGAPIEIEWNMKKDLDCKEYADYKKYEKSCKWSKDKKTFKGPQKSDYYLGQEKCKKIKYAQKKANETGYINWENATEWQHSLVTENNSKYSVPDSCCKTKKEGCGIYDESVYKNVTEWRDKTINKNGCHYDFYKEVKHDVGLGNTAGVVVIILQLLLIAFSIHLVKQIDPQGGGHH